MGIRRPGLGPEFLFGHHAQHSEFPSQKSLLAARDFPVRALREIRRISGRRLRPADGWCLRTALSRGISLYFPYGTGNSAGRDEFAPDCPHRHSVFGIGDFPHASDDGPVNSRDSAGFWRLECGVSEPETVGWGSTYAAAPVCLCCHFRRFGLVVRLAAVALGVRHASWRPGFARIRTAASQDILQRLVSRMFSGRRSGNSSRLRSTSSR
jgi:hypothetical protein